jgi:hypothetical protein
VNAINQGMPKSTVAYSIARSQEAADNTVRMAYRKYLQREAEPAAVVGWSSLLLNHLINEAGLVGALMGSAEFHARNTDHRLVLIRCSPRLA